MDDVTKTDKMLARKDGGVGYVIFNNPERHNAVSLDMWNATTAHPRRLRQGRRHPRRGDHRRRRQGVRLGRRHLEVRERARPRRTRQRIYNETVERAYASIQEYPKPTIAMIRGYCIGGGLGLAVCCDLRICSDNSKFAVPAAKLGLGYGYQRAAAARSTSSARPSPRRSSSPPGSSTPPRRCRWASSTASCRRTSSRAT